MTRSPRRAVAGGELAAGGVDVGAAVATHRRTDAEGVELPTEAGNGATPVSRSSANRESG